MVNTMREDFLWVEKYRPKKIADAILPSGLKKTFQEFVDNGELPNLLLSGSQGTGKTTVARALCDEVGADYIIINGSMNGNIDTLRNDIKNFASTVSLNGGRKVVILDEADYLNPQSTQPALRGFIEEFSKNCSFILTCNFKNRIIAPLHSRCSVIDFKIENSEKPKLAGGFFKRVMNILETENVSANQKVVAEVINRHFPDNRRILNELQRYGASGTIDEGILSVSSDANIKELMRSLKEKNFKEVRKWVALNIDNDPVQLYRNLYDNASTYVSPRSIPQLVVTLADYQYKSAFVADQEINLVACLTELMVECEFI
jgi:DNA polymerase III delta prime subunit